MSERAAIRTLILVAMNVGIAFPLSARAQSPSEMEVACDDKDALQNAIAAITPGGRIIIRSGTCTGNVTLDRDVRIQGSGADRVTLRAANASAQVLTVPRGVTATISGVTIAGGRVGVSVTGRAALVFTVVSDNLAGGIDVRDGGALDADKLKVSHNKGPGISVIKAEAALRGSAITQNVSDGDGGGGMLLVGGRAALTGSQVEGTARRAMEAVCSRCRKACSCSTACVFSGTRLGRATAAPSRCARAPPRS